MANNDISKAPGALATERHGINTVPEGERRYRPRDLFVMLYGSDLTYSVIIMGSLPIVFGLGWWASVTAILVGCFVGGLLLSPMGLFGPKTGTNNAVSSGAHFGILGRVVGSCLALFSALLFGALTIWTSGDALSAGVARMLDVELTGWGRGTGYAVIFVVVLLICLRGFHLILKIQQTIMMPLMSLVLLVGIFAFAPAFDPGYAGGAYLFGSFEASWTASALVVASTVLSYGPFLGDWARYIDSKKHRDGKIAGAVFLGGFVGMGVPLLWGAFISSTFAAEAADFIPSMVLSSPGWYVPVLVLIGLVAGIGQGTIGLYGTGLDMSSIVPRLNRQQATLVIGGVMLALVYLGSFVWDAIPAVNAALVVLITVTTPWIVIMTIGYFFRRGFYLPDDLQVFTRGEKGGRYWFDSGWNWRALVAWVVASAVGMMFAAAPPFFTGPWSNLAGGIDLSFVSAAVVALVLYIGFLIVSPEPKEVFGERGPLVEFSSGGMR